MLLSTALPVTASAASGSDQWEYDATIYLWGSCIDTTTQTGGDIDISFSDIVKDLDMAFMGSFGAHKGKWSLLADAIYMDISQSDGGSWYLTTVDDGVLLTCNKLGYVEKVGEENVLAEPFTWDVGSSRSPF